MSPRTDLQFALSTPDFREALRLARSLAALPPSDLQSLLPDLAAALAQEDPPRRRRAVLLHAVLGSAVAGHAPLLLAALDSPHWLVREAAATALARVAPALREALPALVQHALFDRSRPVREAVRQALTSYTTVPPEVTAALAHHHARIRCRALHAFATLQPPAERVAVLACALDDSHFRVRQTAAALLGQAGTAALPALGRLVRRSFDREGRVALRARESLARIQAELPEPLPGWVAAMLQSDAVAALDAIFQNEKQESAKSEPERQARDANPSLGARAQTDRDAIPSPGARARTDRLPLPVVSEFEAVRQRRARWNQQRKGHDPAREAGWLLGWLLDRLVAYQGTSR